MSSWVPEDLRRLVSTRANQSCEYCLIHERDTYFGCEVDHIISEKHGGRTAPENLAYACFYCNRHKGTDIATVDHKTNQIVRLFNPRSDSWTTHFQIEGAVIIGQTAIGTSTSRLLGFNRSERILERQTLVLSGRFPPRP